MTRIQQLSIRMMEVGDFPVLMDEIVETALQVTGADMGNIQLLEGGVLKIIAHRGFKSDFLDFFKQVDGLDTACGTAMKGGERVIVEDVASSPIFAGTAALSAMLQAEARAVQSTPLVTRSGEMIGMLSTHYRHPHRPSNRDLRLLDILGRQTADIIERRRAEQALRISEERLRLAQKAAQIGTFEWDIQTGVTTWSAEMEELYGLQPGAFGETQAEWETLVHPEDREAALKRVDEAFNTEMPVEGEWRVIWPDGSTHWLAGRFQVYREPGGTPTRMSGVNFEITERKNNENELRRANQDLEHFAYSASHDLQEPLRSIKIFSELLSGRYSGKLDNEAQAFLGQRTQRRPPNGGACTRPSHVHAGCDDRRKSRLRGRERSRSERDRKSCGRNCGIRGDGYRRLSAFSPRSSDSIAAAFPKLDWERNQVSPARYSARSSCDGTAPARELAFFGYRQRNRHRVRI